MTAPLVLSLFPGIGMLDMAFEQEEFCIVRGPDLLWGGDIKRFHPPAGRFGGVIGGPPCQAHSRLRFIVEANGYQVAEDLIPEFVRCVTEARPDWFLMEMVPAGPVPVVPGYRTVARMLRDVWVGGETMRERRFSFGSREPKAADFRIDTLALHRPDPEKAALAKGGWRDTPVAVGGSGRRKDRGALSRTGFCSRRTYEQHLRLQGLPPDFLSEAPFTVAGKIAAVGNGVPMAMGRAVARAVRAAIADAAREVPTQIPTRAGTGRK